MAENHFAPSPTSASRPRSRARAFSPDAQRERIREFAPENDLQLIGESTATSTPVGASPLRGLSSSA